MAKMHEVIKGMEDITIMEEMVTEIKLIIEEEVGHLKDRSRRNDKSGSNSRSRSGSRVSTNRDRIWCFKCRDYDHFARECPVRLARETSRETELIQQIFNMNEDQTLMQTLLMDTNKDELTITPTDTKGNLKL